MDASWTLPPTDDVEENVSHSTEKGATLAARCARTVGNADVFTEDARINLELTYAVIGNYLSEPSAARARRSTVSHQAAWLRHEGSWVARRRPANARHAAATSSWTDPATGAALGLAHRAGALRAPRVLPSGTQLVGMAETSWRLEGRSALSACNASPVTCHR